MDIIAIVVVSVYLSSVVVAFHPASSISRGCCNVSCGRADERGRSGVARTVRKTTERIEMIENSDNENRNNKNKNKIRGTALDDTLQR